MHSFQQHQQPNDCKMKQILSDKIVKSNNNDHDPVATAVATTISAAMTASEQQTGVIIKINE